MFLKRKNDGIELLTTEKKKQLKNQQAIPSGKRAGKHWDHTLLQLFSPEPIPLVSLILEEIGAVSLLPLLPPKRKSIIISSV